jgi:predicted dehydrogenase/NADPH:quinone reductase-like Zn-dependent oxidoreductase
MKQVLRRGLRHIVVDEVPDPTLRPHHVTIRPAVSLISAGTETASIHRESIAREVVENPSHVRQVLSAARQHGVRRTAAEVRAKFSELAVLGYSGAGVVVDAHDTVRDLPVGTRVAYGGEGTGHAEYVSTGRNLAVAVPDAVSWDEAAFTTLGSIALNAVRVAELSLGDSVVVIGLGIVGQLVSQLARLSGARVVAVDLLPNRLQLATDLGAPHGVLADTGCTAAIRTLTDGIGADCVIVAAAAKSAAPTQLALELLRDRGRIVIVGAVDVSVPWSQAYMKEARVLMARAYGPGSYDPAYEREGRDYPLPYVRWTENRNMEAFLDLLAAKQVRTGPLVTHRYALAEAPKAYDAILDPASRTLAVLLDYPAAGTDPSPVTTGAASSPPHTTVTLGRARGSSRFNVALVGAGNIARWVHLPAVARVGDAALRAVHSSSGARAKSYARRFGASYCTTDLDEILADPQVDVVVIASRNQHHAGQAAAALRAGKHVFVEKPMALTREECRDLAQARGTHNRQLGVGFNRRFAPAYQDVKRVVTRGSGPFVMSCRVSSPGISGDYWMADPAIGGAILGEACHFVDLMYWLLDAEPIRISASSLPDGMREPIPQNNVTAVIDFADGSIATLTYCTVGTAAAAGERLEVYGSGTAIATQDFHFARRSLRSRVASLRVAPDKGYRAQMAAFFDALRDGGDVPVGIRDGARSTVACLELIESARSRQPRPVDWIESLG